jgi:hypothetical protein
LTVSHAIARGLCLLLVLTQTPSLLAQNLYRYSNHDGVQVIDDHIPPEFVAKGYDILSPSGTLLKSIPRQLSEEELLLRNTEESRARLREEEEQKMQAWDESLLLRYSDVADIEAARERSVRDLKIRISILKSNLLSFKGKIERQQAEAADIERSGEKVPQSLLDNIDSLKMEIEDIEAAIALRQEEINKVETSYQRDIDRFAKLQNRIQMRR